MRRWAAVKTASMNLYDQNRIRVRRWRRRRVSVGAWRYALHRGACGRRDSLYLARRPYKLAQTGENGPASLRTLRGREQQSAPQTHTDSPPPATRRGDRGQRDRFSSARRAHRSKERLMSDGDSPGASVPDETLRRMLTLERYPRSAGYDPRWVIDNLMGPNVLWLTEALTDAMRLTPGMRVLDLGCGKALS